MTRLHSTATWLRSSSAALALLVLAVVLLSPVRVIGDGPGTPVDPMPVAEAEDQPIGRAMTLLEVAVIAVVEGVTEFLPISSTGHILLVQRAMGIPQTDGADAFAVVIQAGAILAVIGLYYQRSRQMAVGLLGRDADGLRLLVNILLAFLPFALIALLLYDHIKDSFGLWESVWGWFVGGVVLLIVVWYRRGTGPHEGRSMDDLTWRMAIVIGAVQCAAMWPGTSRALAAILGGLLVGMSVRAAVEFSFLLGVVTLLAAAGYDAYAQGHSILAEYGVVHPLVGFALAALAAAAAVKWMVSYLERYSMAIFGYYRIAVALAVAALLLGGWMTE
ncbi:MAG: undecaprenyl-diphosphate phosphatase [Phycisphaeraceae bacterium]